jgi:hypothetical protein
MTAPDLTNSKFWIVVPQAGTNYIYNPRLDKPQGLTGYTVVNGTQALSDTYKRWGVYSIEVTPTASVASSVHYDGVPIATGVAYTFSVYVKGVAGQAMRIVITNSAGTAKQTKQFTASGEWQRVEVTHTGTENASTYECWVTRDSVASTAKFYIDGFQYEQASKASTFIHGDAGDGYSWAGLPRVSASIRSDRTRAGGRLLCINDYAKILQVFGFGMGQFEQIMYPMSNGGDYYQQHLRRSRNVGFLLAYWGDNQGDMQRNRNTILEAVRPDYLDNQPVKIIYQGFDDLGNEATNPLEITCVLQPSHVDTPSLPVFQKDTLMFTVPSGHFDGAYEEGAELDLYEELAVENIVMRDGTTGQWSNMDGGLNSTVYVIKKSGDGNIYVGGNFTDAGGDSAADYIAKWNGAQWSSVGSPNLQIPNAPLAPVIAVADIVIDADANIFICGRFSNAGGAALADFLAKFDGTNWGAVGSSQIVSTVDKLCIDDNGKLYIAGGFTSIGGDTDLKVIAYYDFTDSSWHKLSTGISGSANSIVFGYDKNLYIGGSFTDAGGSGADNLTKWDGTAFSKLGDVQLNGQVNILAVDNSGNLIAGGQFTNAGGVTKADYIAKWNGSQWETAICIQPDSGGVVYNLFIVNNSILTAGSSIYADRYSFLFGRNSVLNIPMVLPYGTFGVLNAVLQDENGHIYFGGVFSTTNESLNAVVSSTHTITNSGNTNVYPKFVITGPGVLESISNYRTKKVIQFDDLTLQAGESITISLDPSNLYMVSSWEGRGNVLRYVAAGSDYGDFSLEPGENYINVYMPSGTDANSGGYITYTPRFWNIEGAIYE